MKNYGITNTNRSRFTFADRVYHISIALLPLLLVYNFPIINYSFGTIILIAFVPHSLNYVFTGLKHGYQSVKVFPFFCLYLYFAIRAEGSIKQIILCTVAFINIWGIAYGAVSAEKIRSIMVKFSMANLVAISIQLLLGYGVGYRLRLYIPSLLQNEYKMIYFYPEATSGLYRPCGFFLEPAHNAEYCLFTVIALLFPTNGKADVRTAALTAMEIIMTTSGIGILLTGFIFGFYILFQRGSIGEKVLRGLKWLLVLSIVFFILTRFSFFKAALNRIFSEHDGYNAVEGRTSHWVEALSPMQGGRFLTGYGGQHIFPKYLTGLPDTIYRFGLIAVVLEATSLLFCIIQRPCRYSWCCLFVYIAIFCAAHISDVFSQVFYFGLIINETYTLSVRNRRQDKYNLRNSK